MLLEIAWAVDLCLVAVINNSCKNCLINKIQIIPFVINVPFVFVCRYINIDVRDCLLCKDLSKIRV